jgi:hypothetical protein
MAALRHSTRGAVNALIVSAVSFLLATLPTVGIPIPNVAAATGSETTFAVEEMKPRLLGAASCASAACHNAGGPAGSKRSEYTTWLTKDKHSQAYAVLLTERSRTIESNFRRVESQSAHAEKDSLCLKCHATDGPSKHRSARRAEGVSCESCHGAAEQWLSRHYLAKWGTMDMDEKHVYGMKPTKILLERAKACVDCHVGAADREVNHDLIAAGHPRLNFELSAYLALIPRHWDERADKARYPDLEARAWATGQMISAAASLELLAVRARDAQRPWPEFAEYDCFACHRGIQGKIARGNSPSGNRASGTLPWGSWYLPLLGRSLLAPDERLSSMLTTLRSEMEKPIPNRTKIQAWADSANVELGVLAQIRSTRLFTRPSINALFGSIVEDEEKLVPANWDSDAQTYLALAALYHARTDLDPRLRDPETIASLQAVAERLRFAPGSESPRNFERWPAPIQLRLKSQ